MAKFNIKETAINHVEKVVFAIVIVVVLIGLAGADWTPYQGTPGEIVQNVTTGEAALVNHRWPEEEREQFVDIETQPVVQRTLYAGVDPRPWETSERLYKLPTGSDEPVTEPVLVPLQSPVADSSRAFLLMADSAEEDDESEPEELAMTTEEETENRFGDELAAPNPNGSSAYSTGLVGGGYGEDLGIAMSYESMAGDLGGYGSGGGSGTMEGMTELGGYGAGGIAGAALPERNGQGYHYVAVRAVFPLYEQIQNFAKATNTSFALASMKFKILDFELQRQMLLPDGQNWTDWDNVQIEVAYDVLTKVAGFEQDVVSNAITNPVITMPLPMRISGAWKNTATHERIKNFELSPQEMQLEQDIMKSMLDKLVEEKKQQTIGITKPKGFNDFSFGLNNMASDLMGMGGGGYSMGMFGMGSGGEYGGSAASGYSGSGSGYGSSYGASAGYGPGSSRGAGRNSAAGSPSFKTLIDDMVKGKKKDDDLKSDIDKWLKDRLTAAGQLILFRYFDFGVEPGKTYQYRVRLVLENPNYGKRPADAGGMMHVIEGDTRTTPWSEVTKPVRVKDQMTYFLTEVSSPKTTRILPTAHVDVYQWDPKFGTMVSDKIELLPGQSVGYTKDTEVIDLAKQTMEKQKYTFASNIYLIDAMEDLRIDPKVHTGDTIDESLRLDLPRGYSDRFRNDVMILVKNNDGRLERVSQGGGSSDHKYMDEYMDYQKETYAYLDRSKMPDATTGGYGTAEGEGGYGGLGGMMGGEMGLQQRGRSLRKNTNATRGSSGGGRSGSGSRSMGAPGGGSRGPVGGSSGSRSMGAPGGSRGPVGGMSGSRSMGAPGR